MNLFILKFSRSWNSLSVQLHTPGGSRRKPCTPPPSPTFIVVCDQINFSHSFPQRADQQAPVTDRPTVCVLKGPCGGAEESTGTAVLALPAEQRGRWAGAVDCTEGVDCQLTWTGSGLWACNSKCVTEGRAWFKNNIQLQIGLNHLSGLFVR